MLKLIKRISFYVIGAVYLFISTFLLPEWFNCAFNYTKGICLNQDGIVFIPFGFFMIILTILVDVLVIKKAIKINEKSFFRIIIVIIVSLIIIITPTAINLSSWQNFFECFEYFKGLNFGKQM